MKFSPLIFSSLFAATHGFNPYNPSHLLGSSSLTLIPLPFNYQFPFIPFFSQDANPLFHSPFSLTIVVDSSWIHSW